MRRILVNTYSSWWRRKWNGEQPTDELPERGASTTTPSASPATCGTRWAGCPAGMRAVVVLRYFEDLTEAETADLLGDLRRHRQEPDQQGARQAADRPVACAEQPEQPEQIEGETR